MSVVVQAVPVPARLHSATALNAMAQAIQRREMESDLSFVKTDGEQDEPRPSQGIEKRVISFGNPFSSIKDAAVIASSKVAGGASFVGSTVANTGMTAAGAVKGKVSGVKNSIGIFLTQDDGGALIKEHPKPLELDKVLDGSGADKTLSRTQSGKGKKIDDFDSVKSLSPAASLKSLSRTESSKLQTSLDDGKAPAVDAAAVKAKLLALFLPQSQPRTTYIKPGLGHFIGENGEKVPYKQGKQLRAARDPEELGEHASELKTDPNKWPTSKPLTLHGDSPQRLWVDKVPPPTVAERVAGVISQPLKTVGGAVASVAGTVAGGVGSAAGHVGSAAVHVAGGAKNVATTVAGGIGGAANKVFRIAKNGMPGSDGGHTKVHSPTHLAEEEPIPQVAKKTEFVAPVLPIYKPDHWYS